MGDDVDDLVGRRLQDIWMPGDWFPCSPEALEHYAAKARVLRRFGATRVIEIGTRCGYSLAAFHAITPQARFLCIDGAKDQDSTQCLTHWRKTVAALDIDAQLVVASSHDIKALPDADFAHVDGDHSYQGALADLHLVSHVPVILADDVCNPDVDRAVVVFCAETGSVADYYHDGLRTAAVITRAE